VIETQVGYTGGKKLNPTYQSIGDHTEALMVTFDPSKTSYATLAGIFWSSHNAKTDSSYSCQYKNALWYLNEEQKQINAKLCKKLFQTELEDLGTTVDPLGPFYRAEEYHQKYFEKNGTRW